MEESDMASLFLLIVGEVSGKAGAQAEFGRDPRHLEGDCGESRAGDESGPGGPGELSVRHQTRGASMAAMRFAYKQKTLTMALAAVFFVLCAVALFFRAASNDSGLILNGIIEMDQGSASIFYYVLAGLSAVMAAGGVFGFATSMGEPRFVVLDDTGVEIPGYAGRKPVRIAYDAITGLQPGGAYKQRWIYVVHRGGRQAIMGSMLANAGQLDEIGDLLAARVRR
jgi:hypothetical protein